MAAYNNLAGFNGYTNVQQPPMIGSITPIGYGGYNGGYYSGQYNYNPYAIKQMQEMQLAQSREVARQQTGILQKIYKSVCSYNGTEPDTEVLNSYDPNINKSQELVASLDMNQQQELYRIQAIENKLNYHAQVINNFRTADQPVYGNSMMAAAADNISNKMSEYQQNLEGVGMVEYWAKYAAKDYMSALESKSRNNTNNIQALYNPTDYNSLIAQHKGFSNAFDPNASIDDQEIRLPGVVSDQHRLERRRAFMESILSTTTTTGIL